MLVPVPVIPPGLIVHVPVLGKPLNTTLPVEVIQDGCAMMPTTGAAVDVMLKVVVARQVGFAAVAT